MFTSKKQAIQFIKDYANSSIYYAYLDELTEYLSKQEIDKIAKRYNVYFTDQL